MTSPAPKGAIHPGAPYGLALVPYLALSLCLHAAIAGGYAFVTGKSRSGDSAFAIKTFGRPAAAPQTIAEQLEGLEAIGNDRPRRYRLSYYDRIVLPQPEPVVDMAVVPPELTPAPEIPTPKPTPNPPRPKNPTVPTPAPVEGTGTPSGDLAALLRPETSVAIGELKGVDGELLMVPRFELRTLRDDLVRRETDFLRYPAIFIVGDISTEEGMSDMYTWAHLFHDLLHFPNVVTPPYVLAVGEAVAKPDFLTPDLAEDAMLRRWEKLQLFAGPVWGDAAFDREGEFLDGLDITKLDTPQIYVMDLDGYIRIMIKGRLDDLSREEILQIVETIKDQWGMTPAEHTAARIAVLTWQSNLKAGRLGPPTRTNPEAQPLVIPSAQPSS